MNIIPGNRQKRKCRVNAAAKGARDVRPLRGAGAAPRPPEANGRVQRNSVPLAGLGSAQRVRAEPAVAHLIPTQTKVPPVTPMRARTRTPACRYVSFYMYTHARDPRIERACFQCSRPCVVRRGRRTRNQRKRAVETQNRRRRAPCDSSISRYHTPARRCGAHEPFHQQQIAPIPPAKQNLRFHFADGPVPVDLEKISSCSPAPLRVAGTLGKSTICSR